MSDFVTIDQIVDALQSKKGDWRIIAQESGVPYFTLVKIAWKTTKNPRIDTVAKLAAYLDIDRQRKAVKRKGK